MTADLLKIELDRAEDAELHSDEQLRQLTDLIDKACAPNPTLNAADCARIVGAALALNDRLRARTDKLRDTVMKAAVRSGIARRNDATSNV